MKKINLYVFSQIFKSCTLVFFIFISIAWLMQISRIFAFLNNLQINFLEILILSSYLIPNLITVIMPFIVIFGLVLSFIKFDKDKEIIAMFSLGIPINEIKKPILTLAIILFIFHLLLNFFLSPYIYEKYKEREFQIRNTINLQTINLTNFMNINKDIVLDFKKDQNKYSDIFIKFEENGDNIIFAKDGFIESLDGKFIFNLINGFKLNILNDVSENLKFKNYKLEFKVGNDRNYEIFDKNSQTIFNLIEEKNYRSIFEKIIDATLLILIIIFFYKLLIKENNFTLKRIFIFIIFSILVNINNNVIKNIESNIDILILINVTNILLLLIVLTFYKYKRI
jgi:lipopolysaccharide export LptBFGC system permease protein LptF